MLASKKISVAKGPTGGVLKKPHWADDGRAKHIHWQIVSKSDGREVVLPSSIATQMKEFLSLAIDANAKFTKIL